MASGLEIRAQIDSDVVKGLLLLNGGGAVSLLALLPAVIGKPDFQQFLKAILFALLLFQGGLISCIIHNRLRRLCSIEYERNKYKPKAGNIWIFQLNEPRICFFSTFFMWVSLTLFFIAGLIIFRGGINTL